MNPDRRGPGREPFPGKNPQTNPDRTHPEPNSSPKPNTSPAVPPTIKPEKTGRPNNNPDKTPGSAGDTSKSDINAINQLGQNSPPPRFESDIHIIPIIGQIEGHLVLPPKNKTTKYEHILPQLIAVEESSQIHGLLVILNTVGGDIEAGLAIAELLGSMNTPTVSLVLGGGHSIGVPIAVATDYSYIVSSASMTVHPIRLTGMVIGVPQTYEYLDKMQDRVIRFITEHSNISEKKFRELMFRTGELVRDIGTVLIGEDAVGSGIINEVGGLNKALHKLRTLFTPENGG